MKNGKALGSRSWASRIVVLVVVLMTVVAVFAGAVPASAAIMIDDGGGDDGGGGEGGGDDGGGDVDCLGGISAWLTAEPTEVKYGESTTLSWYVDVPQGCPAMTYSISYLGPVNQSGSQVVQVLGPTTALPNSWELRGQIGSQQLPLAWTAVRFISEVVTITSNNEVEKFVKAITEKPYARVEIKNDVVLNLSDVVQYLPDDVDALYIQPGVQIIGGRSATNLGPLLYTSTYPSQLFLVGTGYQSNYADHVRISGIRLQGANYNSIAAEDGPAPVGIAVWSSI